MGAECLRSIGFKDDGDDLQSHTDVLYAILRPKLISFCRHEIDIDKKFAKITYNDGKFKEKYCLSFRINDSKKNNTIEIIFSERLHRSKFRKMIKGMVVGKKNESGKMVWEKKKFISDNAFSNFEAKKNSDKAKKRVSFDDTSNTTADIPRKEKMKFFTLIDFKLTNNENGTSKIPFLSSLDTSIDEKKPEEIEQVDEIIFQQSVDEESFAIFRKLLLQSQAAVLATEEDNLINPFYLQL